MTPAALTVLATDDNVAEVERLHAEGSCPWWAVKVVRVSRLALALRFGEPDAVDRAEWDRLTPAAKRARLEQAKIDVRLPREETPTQ